MIHPNIRFWRAVGTMVGSVIGVGVFGLPYTFAQSGYVASLLTLLVVAGMMLVLQFMYAEVALQTTDKERLIGYVRRYAGNAWSHIAFLGLFATLGGAMLAYVIVGGEFLYILLSPLLGGSETLYGIVLAVAGGFMIYRGLRVITRLEVVIMSVLVFLFAFVALAALPHVEVANLLDVNGGGMFAVYGVVLFSLAGMGAVPEMEIVLGKKDKNHLPGAIITAMTIIVGIYVLFSFSVVGVTGPATTPSAFEGLIPTLGPLFGFVGALLGSLTIFSIFMLLGVEMKNTLRFDYQMKNHWAALLIAGTPLVLYLLGFREFIDIISFVGAVFGGILGIMIVLTYERMRRSEVCEKHKCLNVPVIVSALIIAVFLVGIVLKIAQFL